MPRGQVSQIAMNVHSAVLLMALFSVATLSEE